VSSASTPAPSRRLHHLRLRDPDLDRAEHRRSERIRGRFDDVHVNPTTTAGGYRYLQ